MPVSPTTTSPKVDPSIKSPENTIADQAEHGKSAAAKAAKAHLGMNRGRRVFMYY